MRKEIWLIILVLAITVVALMVPSLVGRMNEGEGVITPLGNTEPTQEIKLSAEAYYIDSNEAVAAMESAYIEGSEAKDLGAMFSGEYKTRREVPEIEDFVYMLTPVYTGRSIDEIDKYSVDFVPSDDGTGTIYGPTIYVIDDVTIGIASPKSGNIWIAKKEDGSIDLNALSEMMKKAQEDAVPEGAEE